MVNVDTLILVSMRKSFRQRFMMMFEEEYNILESKTLSQGSLLTEQNQTNIATVILDAFNEDDEMIHRIGRFCAKASDLNIPVIVSLSHESSISEENVFSVGASDVIFENTDSQVIQHRVLNKIKQRREYFRLHALLEKKDDQLMHAGETMIDILSALIEYRSAESGLHIQRIRRFTKILLDEMARACPEYGLTEQSITKITSASAMHDIGKIAIPDHILNKPGKLLPNEYEIIKTHSVIGAQILEKTSDMLDNEYRKYAYNICKYHHERWDGKGYPEGIMEDEIPICAQVVGLADVYDALTTQRVYKGAFSNETAVQMIINGECGQFSPKLLECFKAVQKPFAELSIYYSDDRVVREDKVVDLRLPGPIHQENVNSLHKAQNKYRMLLHHMNATVIEMSLTQQNYHVVHNPIPALAVLSTGNTFRDSVWNLLNRYAHEYEREKVVNLIFSNIKQHLETGLKRQIFEISFGGGEIPHRTYEITLMSTNRLEDNQALMMIWQEKEIDSAWGDIFKVSKQKRFIIEELIGQCTLNDDQWLTIEDNRYIAQLLGYTPNEFAMYFKNRLTDVVVQREQNEIIHQIRTQLKDYSEVEVELCLHHRNGSNVHALFKGRGHMGERGIEQIVGVIMNVERSHIQHKQTRQDLERIMSLMNHGEYTLFEWDVSLDEMVYTKNWSRLFGFEPNHMKVMEALQMSEKFHPEDLEKMLNELLYEAKGKKYTKLDVRLIDKNGRYIWQRINATLIYDQNNVVTRIIGAFYNIDQEKRSEQILLRKTELDPLTRLFNKEAGRKYVEECLAEHREKEHSALLLIDMDNFKGVNDRYGHMFGDAVLCEVARVIKKYFRPDDIVARIGGDEFMVMMRHSITEELVRKRCGALLQDLNNQLKKLIREGDVGCSIGVALAPDHANNYADLFQRADQALYMSKKNGKNTFNIYDLNSAQYIQLHIPQNTERTRIESDEDPGLADSGIVRHAFKLLYEAQDEEEAINNILKLIGEQMNVDRVYIFENTPDNQYCDNTFEWCNKGIVPQISRLQHIHYERDIPGFLECFNEQGIFYCPDVKNLEHDMVKESLERQSVKSVLICAIRDKGVFRGYVGFDECTEERVWTKEQINVLIFFSEMLSVFLLKMRVQKRTNVYAKNLTTILNSRSEYIYVVDAETFEIRFINTQVKKLSKSINIGLRCYEAINGNLSVCDECPTRKISLSLDSAVGEMCNKLGMLMHVEVSLIDWQDRKAYLVVCQHKADCTEQTENK